MSHDRPRYLSYLLRLWQVKGKRGWQWWASLESPGSGKLWAFPSQDQLTAFLREKTGQQESGDEEYGLDE